jgi:hypothetical protein|tara:strand:+ start:6887 stop:7156 length:270 start_codon:yes stop_codon:yes gene_type:complete
MMTDEQMKDRLALIRKVGNRRNKMANLKAKSKALLNSDMLPKKSKLVHGIFIPTDDMTNVNTYTDAPKYAKMYYGETAHETTKFDNDWN